MNVHVHIDRLVLDGIDSSAAPAALQTALQAELARLIGAAGLPLTQGTSLARVAAPQVALQAGAGAGTAGAAIAGAVYGAIAP